MRRSAGVGDANDATDVGIVERTEPAGRECGDEYRMKFGLQTTLRDRVEISGFGVHSAAPARVILHPADVDSGIVILRTGLPKGRERLIEAKWSNVTQTALCTVLGDSTGAAVATVEHLMAALAGLGVDNALVEIDGPEMPIMDGSAAAFVAAIDSVGLVRQGRLRRVVRVVRPVRVECGPAYAELAPGGRGLRLDVEIDFDAPAPRKFHRRLAQPSAPAQRLGQVDGAVVDQLRHVVVRHNRALNARRESAQRRPCNEHSCPRHPVNTPPQCEPRQAQQEAGAEGQPCRRYSPARRESDACAEGRRKPDRGQFHFRRWSRISDSMW